MKNNNDTMKRLMGFINIAEKREDCKEVLKENDKVKKEKKRTKSIGMNM